MKRAVLTLALIVAACGGGTDATTSTGPGTSTPVATTAATAPTTTAAAATPSTTQGSQPEPSGDAGITLTIGDETWVFPTAQCAFRDAPAGESGSHWNVSAIQNGSFSKPDRQVYINWEDPDTYLQLYDVESNAEWRAQEDTLTIEVDGNDITASATFVHSETGETAEGSLSATCLSWYDAS